MLTQRVQISVARIGNVLFQTVDTTGAMPQLEVIHRSLLLDYSDGVSCKQCRSTWACSACTKSHSMNVEQTSSAISTTSPHATCPARRAICLLSQPLSRTRHRHNENSTQGNPRRDRLARPPDCRMPQPPNSFQNAGAMQLTHHGKTLSRFRSGDRQRSIARW